LRKNHFTAYIVNTVSIAAATGFIGHILWRILVPNPSYIAKQITVKIDGANTGSGVMIEHQGDRYRVLTNWHVVSRDNQPLPSKALTVHTIDGHKQQISTKKLVRVGKLDLAVLEFHSRYRYATAAIGNADRAIEGDTLYVSGWADPSPQLATRTYQFLVGHLSGRIDKPQAGYALVYTVNAFPGMSGGTVIDHRGNLIGINGRATVDLRTGTVNSVLGIDINRYLRVNGDLVDRQRVGSRK
jgi:S1-C subfamily serine protease